MTDFLSIITPSYNRAYMLDKLYNSLCVQSCKNFEWIVIDDGSTDETGEIVKNWSLNQKQFDIRYFYQKNSGKHCAINKGVEFSRGTYVIIVDSDDMLVPDAVKYIYSWIGETKNIPSLAGIAGLKGKIDGTRLGDYPQNTKYKEYITAKNTERRRKHLLGDKAEIYKTELLKKYPFKTFEGENFLTEATVWDEIAYQGYDIRWYNKIIYLCDYLDDGLTKSGNLKELNNFNGFTYAIQQRIKCNNKLDGMIARGYYYYIAQKKEISFSHSAKLLKSNYITMIIGIALWKVKNKIMRG